jgi:endonuclease/exonuclease/phosphatase (EEP) superfamily protein YafD
MTAAPAGPKPWPRRLLIAAGFVYPAFLLAAVLSMRIVGEAWWVTTVALYLPPVLFALPLPLLVWSFWRRGPRLLLLAQLLAVALIVFPLMGFVLPGFASARPGAPTIRVLSYNVMHAYAGPERIVAEIGRFTPDVVLLQKLLANFDEVQALLRARYPHVDFADGLLLASRFPITASYDPDWLTVDGLLESAAFAQRVLATPLGPIAVYNVHPTSPRVGLFTLGRGGLPVLEQETALRVQQVRALVAHAEQQKVPVVIAGDTNIPSSSPLLRRELGRYRDGFSAAGWGLGYTYPYNIFRWMRIDRVMATEELRFVGFQVGSSDASDHLCVVADLQRR